MIFKGPQGFGRIMNLVILVIFCTIFSGVILFLAQHAPGNEYAPIFTPLNFAIAFIESFAVGYVLADLLPIQAWNAKLLSALHVTNKVASALISTLVFDLVFCTIISFAMGWLSNISTLGWAGTVAAWWASYPICLVLGYAISLAVTPLAVRIAVRGSGFNPAAFEAPAAQSAAAPAGETVKTRARTRGI